MYCSNTIDKSILLVVVGSGVSSKKNEVTGPCESNM